MINRIESLVFLGVEFLIEMNTNPILHSLFDSLFNNEHDLELSRKVGKHG